MKLKFLIILLGLTSLIFSREITLKEAIDIGLKHNYDILTSEAEYKSAKWQKTQAISSFFPSATLSARATHTIESTQMLFPGMPSYDNSGNYGISVSQPIFTGGNIIRTYKIASKTKELKKIILRSKINDIKAQITAKYFEVIKQKLLLSITKQELKSAKKNLAIAIEKFHTGLISQTDLLQIQLNKKNLEIGILNYKSQINLALNQLNEILGGNEDYQVSSKQKINYKLFKSPIDTLMKYDKIPDSIIFRCKEVNPSLKISKISLKISLLSHRMSYASFLPTLALTYNKSWQKNWNTFDDYKNFDFSTSSSYGINFSMPIFPVFNNYSNFKKSLWEYKKSNYTAKKTENSIITALKTVYWQFITLFNRIESSKIALNYADQMYKISQEKFKNDLISANELLTAEISYQNAQFNYINTIYQFINIKNNLKNMLNFNNDDEMIKFLLNLEEN